MDIRVQDFLRIIRTTPDTVWRLGQFGVNQDTIIELDDGKIFILDDGVESDSRPLRIVTPAGTASPRGTMISVEHDKDLGETEVDCFRGICELENQFGKQLMKNQKSPFSWTRKRRKNSLNFQRWTKARSWCPLRW